MVFFNNWLFHSVYGKVHPRRSIILKFMRMPRNDQHRAELRSAPRVRADNELLARHGNASLRAMTERLPDYAGTEASAT